MARPAPTEAHARTSNRLEPARSSCANAASGTRKAAENVSAARASFFGVDIVTGSLCMLQKVWAKGTIATRGPLSSFFRGRLGARARKSSAGRVGDARAVALGVALVLVVLRREGDVDRRKKAENEHLHDAYQGAQDEHRHRQEKGDHAEHDRDEQVIDRHVEHETNAESEGTDEK